VLLLNWQTSNCTTTSAVGSLTLLIRLYGDGCYEVLKTGEHVIAVYVNIPVLIQLQVLRNFTALLIAATNGNGLTGSCSLSLLPNQNTYSPSPLWSIHYVAGNLSSLFQRCIDSSFTHSFIAGLVLPRQSVTAVHGLWSSFNGHLRTYHVTTRSYQFVKTMKISRWNVSYSWDMTVSTVGTTTSLDCA
jgi:hypothetical protein